MYILEITTNDNRETLLKREKIETWQEVNDWIDDLQDLAFENVYIKLYRETDGEDLEYLGDFTETTRGEIIKSIKKKNNNIIIWIAGLLLFPIMVINRLIKK